MAKNKSVRHHFIPQFYLQRFVDSKNPHFIWIYRKDTGAIIKSSVKDTAVHEHYYSFKTEGGVRDSQTLEKWFSKIEGRTSALFQKIFNKEILSDEEKSHFATFLALTLTRVPNYRENMIEKPTADLMRKMQEFMASNKDHWERHIKHMEEKTGQKFKISAEELRQYVLEGDYDIKVTNPDYSLSFMIENAQSVAPVFNAMKWAFFETSDDKYFLTSDNPLYYMDPTYKPGSFYGVGLMNRKLEVTFPLSKNLMLLATWEGPEGYKVTTSKTRDMFNMRTIASAQNFVFAPENSIKLCTLVQKYKGSSP
jgi:hypothetical protein